MRLWTRVISFVEIYPAATIARAIKGILLIRPQTHVMQVDTNNPVTHSNGNDLSINIVSKEN